MSIRDSITAAGYQFFIGIIIFFIFLILGNDLIEEWVNVSISNAVVDGVTIINVITFFSLIGLITALVVTNILIFRMRVSIDQETGKRFLDINTSKAIRSIIGTLLMVYIFTVVISTIALSRYPNFTITLVNFPLIPTLFMIFALGNPATYIGMILILFMIWNFIFNTGLGVELP